MKLKTSFCNATVLKKDITRFLPVWLIYLIGGLLVCTSFMHSAARHNVATLNQILCYGMPIINCGYGLVVAILLFGDLFNSRMCNALHALPLRRETWFSTHVIAGILMALVPNLVLTVVLLPVLDAYWVTALLWLAASMMMYLFFFGLAVLCALATGNIFGAGLTYVMVNAFAMELLWMLEVLILPYLQGVRSDTSILYYFSPVVWLMYAGEYFALSQSVVVALPNGTTVSYSENIYHLAYNGTSFLYLGILAAVGLGLLVLALVLYRRRKLETAGDFAAIAPVRWLIAIGGSLACGMLFMLILSGDTDAEGYIALFLGMIVGFFLLQMLLQKRVKVLNKKTVCKCVVLLLVVAVVLICGAVDILGIASYVPKAEKVEKVLISPSYLSDNFIDKIIDSDGTYSTAKTYIYSDDPATIEVARNVHQLAIRDGQESYWHEGSYITVTYCLKGGRTVTRSYWVGEDTGAYEAIYDMFSDTQYTLGCEEADELLSKLTELYFNSLQVLPELMEKTVYLLWEDFENGRVSQLGNYTDNALRLVLEQGNMGWSYTYYLSDDSLTLQYLLEGMADSLSDPDYLFDGCDMETIMENLNGIEIGTDEYFYLYLDEEDQQAGMLKALWADAEAGRLSQQELHHSGEVFCTVLVYWYITEGGWYEVELTVWDDCLETVAFLESLPEFVEQAAQ